LIIYGSMIEQFVSYNDGDGDGYANVNVISSTYDTKGMQWIPTKLNYLNIVEASLF